MDKITGPTVKAWWFNPRDVKATAIGESPNTGEREFLSPNPGDLRDGVLVLDNRLKKLHHLERLTMHTNENAHPCRHSLSRRHGASCRKLAPVPRADGTRRFHRDQSPAPMEFD
jgi:hypothetical protein